MNKFVLKNSETRFQNAETRYENVKTALFRIFFARTWMDSAQKKKPAMVKPIIGAFLHSNTSPLSLRRGMRKWCPFDCW